MGILNWQENRQVKLTAFCSIVSEDVNVKVIVESLWQFWYGWRQYPREVSIRSSPKHRDARKQRNHFPEKILNGELHYQAKFEFALIGNWDLD